MLRRLSSVRAHLLAATAGTVLAVVCGSLVFSPALELAAASGVGASVLADGSGGLDGLPPYEVLPASSPIAKVGRPGTPIQFRVGTLNILGSQHAGNGTGRASALAGAILARGVSLVGLQEVQDDQLAVLQRDLTGYSIWPGQKLGNNGVRLQIAWDRSRFELVRGDSISTIFDHQYRPIPYVLLRERATGGEFYAITLHNSPHGQESERDAATTREIALVNRLRAQGHTVLLMGDTNEFTEFACRVMAQTGMVGYNGAYYDQTCHLGRGPLKIDWILGGGGVRFSKRVIDESSPISWATDHAFVYATTTMRPLIT